MATPSQPDRAIKVEFKLAPSKSKRFPVIHAFVTKGYDSKPPASSTPVCPLAKGAQLLRCRRVLFSISTPVVKPIAINDADWPKLEPNML
jgi:hypothetical protein